MTDYYLAIDLGASGGRHILGIAEDVKGAEGGAGKKLVLQEVHRFSHNMDNFGDSLIWDVDKIYGEICTGLEKCADFIKDGRLCSLGIDTWGVDYALIDRDGRLIEPVYAYRDSRTEPFFEALISESELYKTTGVAFQPFNTIYQVLADKAAGRLDRAEYMLQLPEYLSHRLTGDLRGKKFNEYTMASTTGLLDARKKAWPEDMFRKLDLPMRLFKPVREPPYDIGCLSEDIQKMTGFNTRVLMVASHDTASAVATVQEGSLYISSGTWSLLGITGDPILSDEAQAAGYTNEGAHNGKIRFLKNIMGLWVLQSLRRELNNAYTFAELESMARDEENIVPAEWHINLNLPRFFAPESMIAEIKDEYRVLGKKVPANPAELAFAVYTSLANCYKTAIQDLENVSGRTYPAISIIGGGSKDAYLNTLTARYTGKTVYAGPSEATSTGNILLQMQAAGDPAVKNGFSELVKASFELKEYKG